MRRLKLAVKCNLIPTIMLTKTKSAKSDVTIKSIIIGLILVGINAYWLSITSQLWGSHPNLMNPFTNVVSSIVPFILLNFLFFKAFNRTLFSRVELLVIYIMATMVTTVSGHAFIEVLISAMGHPFWFASPENEWEQLFWRFIPSWFTVRDPSIIRGYVEGESSIFIGKHLRAWLIPVLAWSAFIFVLLLALLCINTILRKQWTEREKLSYPLIELPLAMTQDNFQFFRSKMMWVGFSIAASVRMLNGFHSLYPIVPAVPNGYAIGSYSMEPWSAIGYTFFSFRLSMVGLMYFMPLDLLFSCWVFYWVGKAEHLVAGIYGWRELHLNERSAGGWIAMGLIAIWISRRYLITVAKHVISGGSQLDESREPMRYRTAVILLIASFVFLFLFCYQAGMSPWAIAVFYFLFFVMGLGLTRVRAELGPPYHEVIFVNPRQVMTQVFGSKRLGGANLMGLTFLYAFNRCNRSHPMPNQLESLKIGEQSNMNPSKLFFAMVLAVVVGTVAAFVSYYQIGYKHGLSGRGYLDFLGWECFNPLQSWLQFPRPTNWTSVGFMTGGFGFVLLLMAMRQLFFWWPLHPAGYVLLGGTWGGMIPYWFPAFVSWSIKAVLLRFGGIGGYRNAAPLFLGLALGDQGLWGVWSIVSLVLQVRIPLV